MQSIKKKACLNCGYVSPQIPKEEKKELYCNICDETFKKEESKEHKKKESHILKIEIIKRIKDLDVKDENEKKKIEKIFNTLTPKYKTNTKNKNTVE